jgi:peptidoglycan-associated lipoprotein
MQKNIVVVIAIAAFALNAGCASKKPKPVSTSAPTGNPMDQLPTSGGANDASAFGNGTTVGGNEDAQGPLEGQLKNRTIYFDLDSSDVRAEYNDLITAHAHYLAANAARRIRIEGNTDERGSREYNIGLGERRAQAVRRALMLQGVNESQITTVSYGEERPAITGHAEEAWSRNRRANIVYLN